MSLNLLLRSGGARATACVYTTESYPDLSSISLGYLEIKQDIGTDIPSVGPHRGIGIAGEAVNVISEAEAIAAGNLDKVDDVKANAHIPSGLHAFCRQWLGVVVSDPEHHRRACVDQRCEKFFCGFEPEFIFQMQWHSDEISSETAHAC